MTKLERKLTCFLPQDLLGFSLVPLFPHSLRKSRSGQDYEAGSRGSPGSNFGSNAGLTNVHHLWKIKSKVLFFFPLICFGGQGLGWVFKYRNIYLLLTINKTLSPVSKDILILLRLWSTILLVYSECFLLYFRLNLIGLFTWVNEGQNCRNTGTLCQQFNQ